VNKLELFFQDRHEFQNLALTLSRIDQALEESSPKIASKIIHIAGTNGKGSTSQFIANILKNEGYTTLLFMSPHINHIEERIQKDLSPISTELFDDLFAEARPYIEKYDLSFFEAIFLMVMLLAGREKLDYLILETGLGGMFDATNTNYISEKLPVITTIAQDHKNWLGSKIEDIIEAKLGIIRHSEITFIGYNQDFIIDIISKSLPDRDLRYIPIEKRLEAERYYPYPFSLNYLNAHNVAEFLLQRSLPFVQLPLPPCRQERFGRVLLDGAHNPSGLMELLKGYTPDIAIISTTSDRDIKKFCEILSRKVDRIILTTLPDSFRAYSVEKLNRLPYEFIQNPIDALNIALKDTDGDILVAGSFYLCGHIRKYLIQANYA
jgi:dihydrofolate synthase/folylpolyglutamate synthase